MKFKLGDKVTSKHLGLPMVGKVIGINAPELVFEQPDAPHPWDEVCPEWRERPIYYVKFNKPQRKMSLQEFQKLAEATNEVPLDLIDMYYQNNIPVERGSQYPEEELEKLE